VSEENDVWWCAPWDLNLEPVDVTTTGQVHRSGATANQIGRISSWHMNQATRLLRDLWERGRWAR